MCEKFAAALTASPYRIRRRKRRSGNHPCRLVSEKRRRRALTRLLSYRQVGTKPKGSKSVHILMSNVVFPTTRCKLKLLKMERIKDYLLMEEEFVQNQERLKPQEEKNQEERSRVDDLRGSPMAVGSLEEIIDDDHAIVSASTGPEYYVSIMSFVDKDVLEPGCSILMHHKVPCQHNWLCMSFPNTHRYRITQLLECCKMTPIPW